jgi:hypothetical protein
MEYEKITEYHVPDEIMGKTIRILETGDEYIINRDSLIKPDETLLYPNPVTPDMFNEAIEGKTTETVETTEDGLSYRLEMSGKFMYKDHKYFGQVLILIVKDADGVYINMREAEII